LEIDAETAIGDGMRFYSNRQSLPMRHCLAQICENSGKTKKKRRVSRNKQERTLGEKIVEKEE
jgi:hypothetical protein